VKESGGEQPPVQQAEVRSYVHIFHEWCKGCGICVAFCPKQVLEMGPDQKAHVAHPENCIRCYLCARRCPDLAVTVTDELEKIRQEGDEE
jgi:2-oxoglutarate ferredoxin oxidoreductase subunit delta